MSSFSALVPWVAVLVIAVVGIAAGVVVVRRLTPGILSAAGTTAKPAATHSGAQSTETTPDDASDTPTDTDRTVANGTSAPDPDRKGHDVSGQASSASTGEMPLDTGGEESLGSAKSGLLVSDWQDMLGYVALGLGAVCLAALAIFDGVYADQLVVVGLALFSLVMLAFFEQLASTGPTLPSPTVGERSNTSSRSTGELGDVAVSDTTPSQDAVSTEGETAARTEPDARPSRHEVPVGEDDELTPNKPDETVDDELDETVDEAVDDEPDETVDDELDETVDEAVDDEPDESVDEAVDDEPDAPPAFACEHCGRDDFTSAAQRNGHLRWCDEYDPNATDDAKTEDTGVLTVGTTAESAVVEPDSGERDMDEATAESDVGGCNTAEATADTSDMAEPDTGERDTAESADAVLGISDSVLSEARQRLDRGDIEGAVFSAYGSVFDAIGDDVGVSPGSTHREFYDACVETFDDERLDALEQLVTTYEQLCFAGGTVHRDEVASLLDRLGDGDRASEQ